MTDLLKGINAPTLNLDTLEVDYITNVIDGMPPLISKMQKTYTDWRRYRLVGNMLMDMAAGSMIKLAGTQ